jgi:nickel transport protein
MTRLVLLILLFMPMTVLAHRVNVFAYAEGDIIHVEGRFQKGVPAQNSEVRVSHAKTGETYLQGQTDSAGRFSFPIPAQARAERADLKILLSAGEGHQNEWQLVADDYLPRVVTLPAGGRTERPKVATPKPSPAAAEQVISPAVCPPPADVSDQIEATVERRTAQLRQQLLDSQNMDPGPREIISGIGYLFGIAGLIAYARSRKRAVGKS